MQSIRQVARLNDLELEKVVRSNASWHTDYRDTAYIYIGGLPFELSEGDVLTIFSQYGNPVDIKLARDKDTGKSRGFGWLKYEDQRSCDLAVDNISGAGVMGRVISVDHTRYQKREGEVETVGDEFVDGSGDETDREGEVRRKRRRMESASGSEVESPLVKEEAELAHLMREHDDDDPMKAYLVKAKKAEVAEALKLAKEDTRSVEKKHIHRHHRSRKIEGDERNQKRRSNGHSARDERKQRSTSPESDDQRDRRRRRSTRDDSASGSERDRRRRKRSGSSEDSGQGNGRRKRR